MLKAINKFLKLEASGGVLLALAAVLALLLENSFLKSFYDAFISIPVVFQFGGLLIDKPLLLWINDGLMVVFFFLVGLEIKYEFLRGELADKEQVILPFMAAIGGLAVPALIYSYINWGDPELIKGWAVPAATDIAFAIAVVTLLGNRVPASIKVCLVTLAIIDDLAAIIIIALFYTESLSYVSLGLAGLSILALYVLNLRNVTKLSPYVLIGIILWVCVLKSGVHATLAGVILAFFIPLNVSSPNDKRKLEHSIHPWVKYAVLPIFAFANSGVSLKGITIDAFTHPITLGIMLGLFFGKQIGIMLTAVILRVTGVCHLPHGSNWLQFYGMSLLAGIGFTMSLFIGNLAFSDPYYLAYVRIGVLTGSFASAVLGYLVLRAASTRTK